MVACAMPGDGQCVRRAGCCAVRIAALSRGEPAPSRGETAAAAADGATDDGNIYEVRLPKPIGVSIGRGNGAII